MDGYRLSKKGDYNAFIPFLLLFLAFGGPRLNVLDFHQLSIILFAMFFILITISRHKIERGFINVVVVYFPALLYSAIIATFSHSGTLELTYKVILYVLYAFSASFLILIYRSYYHDYWLEKLSFHLLIVWLLTSLTAMLFVFSASYRNWFGKLFFVSDNDHWITSGYRAMDLTSGGAVNGAFGYVIAFFYLFIFGRKFCFNPMLLTASLGCIFVAGVFMARTFLVLWLCAVIFGCVIGFTRILMLGRLRQPRVSYIALFLIIFMIFFVGYSAIPEQTKSWAFEFMGQDGRIVVPASLNTLLSRMFFLPENNIDLLFGSGYLGRWESGPFLSSDVGYVRVIFSVGLIGSVMIWLPLIAILVHSTKKYIMVGNPYALISSITALLIIIANSKELLFFPRTAGLITILVFLIYLSQEKSVKLEDPFTRSKLKG